jgi:hypothetical protein
LQYEKGDGGNRELDGTHPARRIKKSNFSKWGERRGDYLDVLIRGAHIFSKEKRSASEETNRVKYKFQSA